METKGTKNTAADAARILNKTAGNLAHQIENAIYFDSNTMTEQAAMAATIAAHWAHLAGA